MFPYRGEPGRDSAAQMPSLTPSGPGETTLPHDKRVIPQPRTVPWERHEALSHFPRFKAPPFSGRRRGAFPMAVSAKWHFHRKTQNKHPERKRGEEGTRRPGEQVVHKRRGGCTFPASHMTPLTIPGREPLLSKRETRYDPVLWSTKSMKALWENSP